MGQSYQRSGMSAFGRVAGAQFCLDVHFLRASHRDIFATGTEPAAASKPANATAVPGLLFFVEPGTRRFQRRPQAAKFFKTSRRGHLRNRFTAGDCFAVSSSPLGGNSAS
jgi:hypothetical protein